MELRDKVDAVIEKVRPALQSDGGNIQVVDILEEEGVVLVKFEGACGGCPMKNITLKNFVEKHMVEEVSEIKEVRLA